MVPTCKEVAALQDNFLGRCLDVSYVGDFKKCNVDDAIP